MCICEVATKCGCDDDRRRCDQELFANGCIVSANFQDDGFRSVSFEKSLSMSKLLLGFGYTEDTIVVCYIRASEGTHILYPARD